MNNQNEFLINEEMVRAEGEAMLGRELTEIEVEQVFEAIGETWIEFLSERISYVDDFNELLDRNEGAGGDLLHFNACHRNVNAYQFKFELAGSFKTEEDAREYAKHNIVTEDDEWEVVRVENGRESFVWGINIK